MVWMNGVIVIMGVFFYKSFNPMYGLHYFLVFLCVGIGSGSGGVGGNSTKCGM